MDLGSLLKPEAVKFAANTTSKKRLLREVADIAAEVYGVDPEKAVEALHERESLGPTGVGDGVAIPHARLDGIDGMAGVFVRLDKPLVFESVDRQPVDLVFALFAPEEAGVSHLKALAIVSRVMRNAGICNKLRANDETAILHAILTTGVEDPKAA